MTSENPKQTFSKFALCGATSGLCSAIVNYPLDTIKTRLQASNSKVNYMQLTQHLGLYKGFSAALMNVPLAATYLGTYEYFKQHVNLNYDMKENWFLNPLSAFIGQVLATTIGLKVLL